MPRACGGGRIADRRPGEAQLIINLIHLVALGVTKFNLLPSIAQTACKRPIYLGRVCPELLAYRYRSPRHRGVFGDDEVFAGPENGPRREGVVDSVAEIPPRKIRVHCAGIVQLHKFDQLGFDVGVIMDLVDDDDCAALPAPVIGHQCKVGKVHSGTCGDIGAIRSLPGTIIRLEPLQPQQHQISHVNGTIAVEVTGGAGQ